MTLWEYKLRMKAYRLRIVDEEYLIYLQAWANRDVQSEKKSGKKTIPVYQKFSQFFDYEERINQILGKSKVKPISRTSSRYLEFMERRREDGKL